jgi:protein-L-isoaspartate O-methyltransferase
MKVKGLTANSKSYLRSLGAKIRRKIRVNLGYPDRNNGSFYPENPGRPSGVLPESLMIYSHSIAPYVPSPPSVARKMLECAELKTGETLYDLGSGDGRIVIMAAREFGARGVGVDLNAHLIAEAEGRAKELGLIDSVQFIHGDMFDVDLGPANVVTMYLLTNANEKMRPKLEKELRPGTRVVTHDFPVANWKNGRRIKFNEENGTHTIYIYIWKPD